MGVNFDAPAHALEQVDAWLTSLLTGAPLIVSLGVACLLGLRHASDPDHLVAVTSLVAAEQGGHQGALRLGAWWGLGHAGTLLAVGMPLVLFGSRLPGWLERGAERGIGLVMILLAARVLVRWLRGEFRVRTAAPDGARGGGPARLRTRRQALAIGVLHGVAGTGAVVVLLLAQLPSPTDAGLALLVFAPMSMLSMVICTGGFAWTVTRPMLAPLHNALLIPALGAFGLMFGTWYSGVL
ncbi:MAG TPA: hypothetical protein VK486_03155 [Thermoleophilaceae bacterium]|nr:hypothetical protein [Thermoleophilaceae bacterium]